MHMLVIFNCFFESYLDRVNYEFLFVFIQFCQLADLTLYSTISCSYSILPVHQGTSDSFDHSLDVKLHLVSVGRPFINKT